MRSRRASHGSGRPLNCGVMRLQLLRVPSPKRLLRVALAAIVVAVASCQSQPRWSNVPAEYADFYNAECTARLEVLDRAVVAEQSCDVDTDCDVIYSAGGCPLECFVAVNPGSAERVASAYQNFQNYCRASFCECNGDAARMEAACVRGHCEVIR